MGHGRVVLFLDVDGVLNALSHSRPEGGYADFEETEALGFPLWLSKQMGAALVGLGVEIRWLTTWGARANQYIADRVGLPGDLVVVAEQPHGGWGGRGWSNWKHLALVDHLDEEERAGRAVEAMVWVDDEALDRGARYWADWELDIPSLLVAPDPMVGLTPADLEQISAFTQKMADR